MFKDFKVEFAVEPLLHSLGNIDFWNLLSFLILKHYLSINFGGVSACKKSFYHDTFLYHFPLYKCMYRIFANFTNFRNHYCR